MSVLACAGVCTRLHRGGWKGEERLGVTDVEISLLRWAFSALLQVTEKVISRRGWFFYSFFFFFGPFIGSRNAEESVF